MSPTPLELSMLPSVRLRPRLTLLSFMEPTDMLDTDTLVTDMLVLDMLVSLDILMPLTVLDAGYAGYPYAAGYAAHSPSASTHIAGLAPAAIPAIAGGYAGAGRYVANSA